MHQAFGVVAYFLLIRLKLVKPSRASRSISLSYYKIIVKEEYKDLHEGRISNLGKSDGDWNGRN